MIKKCSTSYPINTSSRTHSHLLGFNIHPYLHHRKLNFRKSRFKSLINEDFCFSCKKKKKLFLSRSYSCDSRRCRLILIRLFTLTSLSAAVSFAKSSAQHTHKLPPLAVGTVKLAFHLKLSSAMINS